MINYLILMAGHGSRFSKQGYVKPKPFIDIGNDTPMISLACKSLDNNELARYIFVCQRAHEQYGLHEVLSNIAKDNECIIVFLDEVTEGAACSALAAKHIIDTDDELIIMNSDQVLDWSYDHFLKYVRREKATAAIPTFMPIEGDPKWSYARLDVNNKLVLEVREKEAISLSATAGVYYFAKGSDFVDAAEKMISANDRVNNEFYVAPVYNYLSGTIINYPIVGMYGTGTPEDLDRFKCTEYYRALCNL